ncbi:hypothetical protein CDAR_122721 [Caerostris darwini]|uniref:Uncharacterized protein n=1 Tax=Caerostris darwini TaxID=1538125 RepID=A0AAV4UYQ3_9ARAC|nr:hypothetical protein CDAR_122721 [Caerostris darwini]
MKWAVGCSLIRVWLDTEIRTFRTSARDCRGYIVGGLFSRLKEDFFSGCVEDSRRLFQLSTEMSKETGTAFSWTPKMTGC